MTKIIKYSLSLLIIINLAYCSYSDNNNLSNLQFKNILTNGEYEFICKLNENIGFIDGKVNDFSMLTDTTFILSNNSRIYLYNINGEQIQTIGLQGRALGEYISANKLYISDNYIYVWCAMSLKLIVYDKNGDFIKEYNGFDSSITRFVVLNDKTVYFYGNGDQKHIKIYDLTNKKYISQFGNYSDADRLLLFNSLTAGICINNNEVLYLEPSKLIVSSILDTIKKDIFNIIDPDFKVDVDVDAEELMAPPYIKAIEYTQNNSTVTGIHSFNNKIYLVVETGTTKFDPTNKIMDFTKRKVNVFKIDSQYNPIEKIVYDYPLDMAIIKYGFYKNDIFILSIDNDNIITLSKIKS